MRVMTIAGARPNFVKIAPLVNELDRRHVENRLVHTGQHYDPLMSDVFFQDLGIRPPDVNLDVGSGSHAAQTAQIMTTFEPVLDDYGPDVVLVVGDVNSTVACGLVAAKAGSLLGHVEAGLRSRDWAMPEEINRVVTDRLSDLLFAPSEDAVENLRAEGYREDQIHLAGNIMIDTLMAQVSVSRSRPILQQLGLHRGGYGLITLHRPASVDDPATLGGLMEALGQVASRIPLVFPVHPRTRASLADIEVSGDIRLIEPQGYLDFLALQDGAAIVLTDSGGIQEETTALGVPCLTLRTTTERPITIDQGTNRLVGIDPVSIVEAAFDVLEHGVEVRRPALWDGKAAGRIVDAVEVAVTGPHRRPTER